MNIKRIKYRWLPLLLLPFTVIFIFELFQIIIRSLEYQASAKEYSEISELAHVGIPSVAETPAETWEKGGIRAPQGNIGESPIELEPAVYVSPIDFSALLEINPEICGWICIEGTAIDYPIVHAPNNTTYLSTTFSGESNPSGAIFVDRRNMPDFTDKNTIIYGHNMKNGSMFATLTKYKEQSFFEEHPNLTIYTPDGEYVYEIFSAYVAPADSSAYTFEFSEDDAFDTYLEYAADRSLIQTDIEYKNPDRVITLSTCDYTFSNARMIVQALVCK